MGEKTGIAWTDHTFNAWIGCEKVAVPGDDRSECDFCYAEQGSKRLAAQRGLQLWEDDRYLTVENYWKQLPKWSRDALKSPSGRARVFCASFSDVFEDRPDVEARRLRLLRLVLDLPNLDFQLLTKRPENAARLAYPAFRDNWPANAWLGTSIGLRASLFRADILRTAPAKTRFLSLEPLLEDVSSVDLSRLHWVIVGGESGPHARPFDLSWARAIVRKCADTETACFVKQMGDRPTAPTYFEGHCRDVMHFNAHHGADPMEWPPELRVQQFPNEWVRP